jgi:hypothetical protein
MLLLAVAGFSHPVGAQSDATSASGCIQHAQQDAFSVPTDADIIVTINQTTNDSVVRYTFDGYSGDPTYTASAPAGVSITDSQGFEITEQTIERKYNAEQPWVEVALGSPYPNISYVSSDQNAVAPTFESDDVSLYHQPGDTGFAGAQFVLLGPYQMGTAHNGCQRLRVVAPAAVDLPRRLTGYAEALATVGGNLDIGPRYRVVTAIVAPTNTGRRNGFAPQYEESRRFGSEFYISPTARLTTLKNTWVHEYVHTRQLGPGPDWMIEGAATYFAAQISVEEGWVTLREYDSFFAEQATPDGRPNIAKPRDPAYTRGAFFFMQMQQDLNRTNGTVEDIYREVNREAIRYGRTRSIEIEQFESAVESATNRSVEYADPMDNPVRVVYMTGPSWWPDILREWATPPWMIALGVLFLGVILVYQATYSE